MRSIIAFAFIFSVACGGNEHMMIYAPPELAGAAISIDGKQTGRFQDTVRHYRWTGWRNVKKEFGLPPRSETFAKLTIANGHHELRVTKDGFEPIVLPFEVSSDLKTVEIPDSAVKRINVTRQ